MQKMWGASNLMSGNRPFYLSASWRDHLEGFSITEKEIHN
jgi:hypothetical protein